MKRRYFPLTLSVELVKGCFQRCFFCNSWREKEFYFLNSSVWQKILNLFNLIKVDNITPFAYGESLLHPFFYEWLEELFFLNTSRKLIFNDLVLNTSALFLNLKRLVEIWEKYPDSGFHRLHFSVDFSSDLEYLKLGKKNDKESIKALIYDFVKWKQRSNMKEPLLTLSKVYLPKKREEAEDFSNFWSKRLREWGVDFKVYWNKWPEHSQNAIYLRKDTRFLERDDKVNNYQCQRDNLLIRADGNIYLCNSNFKDDFHLGNILEFDLVNYLFSGGWEKFRKEGKDECRNCPAFC